MTILKIDHVSIVIDSDHFMCIVVGGASCPVGKVEPHKITTLARCDAMARRQFEQAQRVPGEPRKKGAAS